MAKRRKKIAYRLLHFIMCDDLRIEAFTNKAILIGVWNRLIVVRKSPWQARQIRFMFALRNEGGATGADQERSFDFSLHGPGDFLIGPLTGKMMETSTGLVTLYVGFDDVVLPAGVYTAKLKLDDGAEFSEEFEVQVNEPLMDQLRAKTPAWPAAAQADH